MRLYRFFGLHLSIHYAMALNHLLLFVLVSVCSGQRHRPMKNCAQLLPKRMNSMTRMTRSKTMATMMTTTISNKVASLQLALERMKSYREVRSVRGCFVECATSSKKSPTIPCRVKQTTTKLNGYNSEIELARTLLLKHPILRRHCRSRLTAATIGAFQPGQVATPRLTAK